MARSTRKILCMLTAVLQLGCITGQAFEGARLDESPEELGEACLQGDWLRVRYRAVSTREFGQVVARQERAAAIRLSHLEARPRLRVDRVEVVALDPSDWMTQRECRAVLVQLGMPETTPANDRDAAIKIPRGVLHRDRTAAWFYPAAPLTVALDVAFTPLLLALWGPYVAVGD